MREYDEMGYNVFHEPRSTGKGGGVGVVIRKELKAQRNKCSVLKSFKLMELTVMCLAENYLLSTIYRTGTLNSITK